MIGGDPHDRSHGHSLCDITTSMAADSNKTVLEVVSTLADALEADDVGHEIFGFVDHDTIRVDFSDRLEAD